MIAYLFFCLFTALAYTHPFNGHFSETPWVNRYQKGKTNLDFTEARDSEWQWHQLGHMQVCTLPQIDNQASTPPLSLLQAGCPSCHPTNSVKALKALASKALKLPLSLHRSLCFHSVFCFYLDFLHTAEKELLNHRKFSCLLLDQLLQGQFCLLATSLVN